MTYFLPKSAKEVYAAWLSSEEHSSFTGSLASIQEELNSQYSAWAGYISGKILGLEKDKRILTSWRTTDFHDSHEDSLLEIELSDTSKGCKLYLKQWNIPEGMGGRYMKGWDDNYFQPMLKYFSK